MLAALILAAILATAPATLSPDAQASIQPVLDAIAAERTAQAALPPAKDDRETLERMGRLDQVGRRAMTKAQFDRAPPEERAAAFKVMSDAMNAVDEENLPKLLAMVPPEGWFSISRYGPDGANAAFLIIQHSGPENWRRFLPAIETMVAKGEASKGSYALMFDRLAMNEGRPQRYGSQLKCIDGRFQPWTLEDPAHIDELRKSMDLPGTYAEYVAAAERMKIPCPRPRG
jgi:hypothetical protein